MVGQVDHRRCRQNATVTLQYGSRQIIIDHYNEVTGRDIPLYILVGFHEATTIILIYILPFTVRNSEVIMRVVFIEQVASLNLNTEATSARDFIN